MYEHTRTEYVMAARAEDPRVYDTSQGQHAKDQGEVREAAMARLLALRDTVSRGRMFADATDIIRRHREARADDLVDHKAGASPQ